MISLSNSWHGVHCYWSGAIFEEPIEGNRMDRQIPDTQDSFTGLANRRHFQTVLALELEAVLRLSEESSDGSFGAVLMADIDHLKKIHDLGHLPADNAIKMVADVFRQSCRPLDLVCRWGGEEFCILSPRMTGAAAVAMADKLRVLVSQTPFELLEHPYDKPGLVTVSFGIACYPKHSLDVDSLIERSETALLKAKSEGRNRVCMLDAVR